MVTADYYYPDWGCLVDFFAIEVEKLLAWAAGDWTHNPWDICSQSGAHDLSAKATPWMDEKIVLLIFTCVKNIFTVSSTRLLLLTIYKIWPKPELFGFGQQKIFGIRKRIWIILLLHLNEINRKHFIFKVWLLLYGPWHDHEGHFTWKSRRVSTICKNFQWNVWDGKHSGQVYQRVCAGLQPDARYGESQFRKYLLGNYNQTNHEAVKET